MAGSANNRVAFRLAAVVGVMVSLSFVAVPFYSWFCRTTGYGGTTSVAEAPSAEVVNRLVTVSFDANTAAGMPWKFRPLQHQMQVRLGETGLAFYEAYNPTDRVVAGQAAYNVAPDAAGKYFDKIACFCFIMQVLQPGERIEMPVTFFVDPEMLKDGDSALIKNITLSYTMFEADLPEVEQSAVEKSAVDPVRNIGQMPDTRVATAPANATTQTIEQ